MQRSPTRTPAPTKRPGRRPTPPAVRVLESLRSDVVAEEKPKMLDAVPNWNIRIFQILKSTMLTTSASTFADGGGRFRMESSFLFLPDTCATSRPWDLENET